MGCISAHKCQWCVSFMCFVCLWSRNYSPSTKGFHVDSRPAKNSCRLSNRSISLEICYFPLKNEFWLIIRARGYKIKETYIHGRTIMIVREYGRGIDRFAIELISRNHNTCPIVNTKKSGKANKWIPFRPVPINWSSIALIWSCAVIFVRVAQLLRAFTVKWI